MFWRVLVLFKNQEVSACHFLDSGKQESLKMVSKPNLEEENEDETLFVPMPGTQEWAHLLSQVKII